MHLKMRPVPIVNRTLDFLGESCEWLERNIVESLRDRSSCLISLCGGNTPKPIYERLATSRVIDWSKVWLSFGDERCVPPDHEQSNYRMAREALIDRVDIPDEQVLRIEGEFRPGVAARRYEQKLLHLAEMQNDTAPRHDIFLLGLGEDGHTTSLFPGTAALSNQSRWAMENYVPKFDAFRVTATYHLINESKKVVFLVSGASKAAVYERILAGESDDPAAQVNPSDGEVYWFLG